MSYVTNIIRVITNVNVDATTTGTTSIGFTPPGGRFCPCILSLEPVNVAGVGGGATYPVISIGTEGPDYKDWLDTTVGGLPALDQYDTLLTGAGAMGTPAKSAAESTEAFINITTATSNITTYTLRISVTGIWYQLPAPPPP